MMAAAAFSFLCLPAGIIRADEAADTPAEDNPGGGEAVLVSPLEGDLTVEDIVGKISGVIFGLALMICPILIIWGGFEIATAGGDQSKIDQRQANHHVFPGRIGDHRPFGGVR